MKLKSFSYIISLLIIFFYSSLFGEEKKIDLDQENALLSTALNSMGYKPNTIVVELNNLIINSMKWEKVKLKDGDKLEIVSIVGGG